MEERLCGRVSYFASLAASAGGGGACVCMCMDLKGYGGGERESESNHLKGKVIHERVRSGKIHSACTSSEHPAKLINFM